MNHLCQKLVSNKITSEDKDHFNYSSTENSRKTTDKSLSSPIIEIDQCIEMISLIITKIPELNSSQTNDKRYLKQLERQSTLSFECPETSSLSIEAYIKRLVCFTSPNLSTVIVALIYIDRLTRDGNIILTDNNKIKIVLAAFTCAFKYNEDRGVKDSYLACTGGVSVKELSILETSLLVLVDYKIYISEKDFEEYYSYFSKSV